VKAPEPVVFAVSDGTGETAEQACRAALAQFSPELMSRIRVIPHVLDDDAVEAAVRVAKDRNALLAYTLVKPTTRARMRQVAEREQVVAVDLLSTLISAIAGHLQQTPLRLPGLGHQLDAEYFRRIEAVEFAVNNDDGRLPHNLRNADIVVVGLSRTSKTPLSNYIAHRGYRVANVPIVPGAPLPPELDRVDPRRVFGLVIEPSTLVNIRRARMEALRMAPESAYGSLDQIRQEMLHALRLFAQHPEWTIVDTTRKAIEETAAQILESYRERFEVGGNGPNGEPQKPPGESAVLVEPDHPPHPKRPPGQPAAAAKPRPPKRPPARKATTGRPLRARSTRAPREPKGRRGR
jgi:regulator of PEP synthase PpsR (kinase-PPPase family)